MRPGAGSANIFVGRDGDMAVLRTALDEAVSGQGRLVMMAGEPGIGKTRVASELAACAQAQAARVFWGWCYEGEGAPPYWPWVQPIRAFIRASAPSELEELMGSGAADIATLLPELHQKLPELASLPQLEPEQARFRLFDSLATFLKTASAATPLVMLLEDLHWADRSSLMFLEFIGKEIADARVMLLGTSLQPQVVHHRFQVTHQNVQGQVRHTPF